MFKSFNTIDKVLLINTGLNVAYVASLRYDHFGFAQGSSLRGSLCSTAPVSQL